MPGKTSDVILTIKMFYFVTLAAFWTVEPGA